MTFSRTHVSFLGLFLRYGGMLRWLALIWSGFACLAFFWSWGVGLFLIIGLGLFLAFFRCPDSLHFEEGCLVAPATGWVDDIEEVSACPVIGGQGTKIGIFLSVFDAHVTCAPIAGKVCSRQFVPGRFRNAMSRDIGPVNQRNEILMETAAGHLLLMRQISGAIARRVVFEPAPGDRIEAGSIVGMIRFGSRVELFIPNHAGFQMSVSLGERVTAGKTLLGRIQSVPNS